MTNGKITEVILIKILDPIFNRDNLFCFKYDQLFSTKRYAVTKTKPFVNLKIIVIQYVIDIQILHYIKFCMSMTCKHFKCI